jgi:hypothetical protein
MTEMLIESRKHREQGHGHTGALKALGRRFNFDYATASRIITRAQAAEALNPIDKAMGIRARRPSGPRPGCKTADTQQRPIRETDVSAAGCGPTAVGGHANDQTAHARSPRQSAGRAKASVSYLCRTPI